MATKYYLKKKHHYWQLIGKHEKSLGNVFFKKEKLFFLSNGIEPFTATELYMINKLMFQLKRNIAEGIQVLCINSFDDDLLVYIHNEIEKSIEENAKLSCQNQI